MKKLKLDVEKLSVESFTTARKDAEAGTVAAYMGPTITVVCGTCDLSCQVTACYDWTCEHTCSC